MHILHPWVLTVVLREHCISMSLRRRTTRRLLRVLGKQLESTVLMQLLVRLLVVPSAQLCLGTSCQYSLWMFTFCPSIAFHFLALATVSHIVLNITIGIEKCTYSLRRTSWLKSCFLSAFFRLCMYKFFSTFYTLFQFSGFVTTLD